MPSRRAWDSLSEGYRRRLERGGVTRESYESGASLKAARGHKSTPENIREYQKNPSRFKDYRERRRGLVQRVIEKKQAAFELTLRYNETHSGQYVRRGEKSFIRPPTLQQLMEVDAMTAEELVDFQYSVKDEEDWRFLWYH